MQNRFIDSITQLPKPVATALIPLLNEDFCGHIDASQLATLVKASDMTEEALLLSLLPIAAALAKPSISEFYVGAIAKGESGDIYMGANFELASEALFHTVHAEQSAISHAWLNGEQKIVDIVVNFSPCGHCRQFINELVSGIDIKIHLPGQQPQLLAHYLPYAFGPKDLQVTKPLLSKSNIEFSLNSDDPMIIEAVDQAGLSYAPYTKNFAAVVIETKDGRTYCGRYAENAAFNPSMMPMQMALSNLIRHDRDYSDINRVVLIESSAGKVSLVNATMDTLQAVAAVELEHIVVDPS
ncbi:cytidine deaminase [Shewanella sp. 1_MG-2023]|uniref:Cytidine deaminase n=1 Tax=Shewanella electrodiphila TaxID=934143 RepID=A0ABT0KPP8_9GAMM|nr:MULTISPECIES: cytidine deaminase [Shewanella]MCC4832375.1 cytidine deaminase [Shewanella sp. 10N.7]MCL1045825.1 cytidine deaminase [Shewanella electrodiphila]MDO6610850.1 cytidine deaminase [Shewanella sp. 7_MG-2023]MDO6770299.1 cytidine deaminase [Shewanella sp. 2_MG-2023]MDO6793440.1 cytidine deaminase [Shewanella sp. 1_MG-2023]